MSEEIIPVETFCSYYHVEQTFVESLESYGLISISYKENQRFILKEELTELEKFSRLYYDLDINIPGIDALKHLLEKIKELQQETEALRARLRIYE
ncbi:MAG TPA: chaperone modulator CbpM [Puia sp.]|jgi:chaperone modulatory protein CbpM|nr:chaperone modulator CbpM [Puia sp.]